MKTEDKYLEEYSKSLQKCNHEKYISESTLSKEWDLVIDEVENDIYSWPLLKPCFCSEIINIAEFNGKWQSDRHEFYPTNDMPLSTIGLDDFYNNILNEYVYDAAIHKWNLEGNSWKNLKFENLTLVPIDKNLIIKELMSMDEIKWLNNYHQTVFDKLSTFLTAEEKLWLQKVTLPL